MLTDANPEFLYRGFENFKNYLFSQSTKTNKTTIFSTFEDVCNYLQNKKNIANNGVFCGESYAVREYIINNHYIIYIWKTFSYFDYCYKDFPFTSNDDLIAIVDYYFIEDSLKIENFIINDFDYAIKKKHFHYLNFDEANQIRVAILGHLIHIAAQYAKKNIVIELQHDSKTYITTFMDYGFKVSRITPIAFQIKYNLLKKCSRSYFDLSSNQFLEI
jgi:hypothetical protein